MALRQDAASAQGWRLRQAGCGCLRQAGWAGASGRLFRLGAGTCGTRVVAGSTVGAVDGRGGTTGIRSVSPSVAAGPHRVRPGSRRAGGGRADLRPRRARRGDDRDAGGRASGSCAGPVERDGTTGTRTSHLGLRRGSAVRTRAGNRDRDVRRSGSDAEAPFERPGRPGGGLAPTGRAIRAAASGPGVGTRPNRSPRTVDGGGPGGRDGRLGGARARDDSDPAGGHIRVRAARTGRSLHVIMRDVRVGRSCAPPHPW